jgi:hypothetical protein
MANKRKDPKAAADAAEARSKKAPKAKTTKADKAGPAVTAAKTNPDVDTEAKALFLHHLPKIEAGKKRIADATNALRILYKSAKADGMLKRDFDVAIEMQGADGEKKKKAAIAHELTIARWMGYDLGAQLDMFLEPERVPATERAYAEGQTASMTGKPLKCDYHETTEQYREFVRGFQDHQVTLQSGFQKLDPAIAEDEADKAAKKAIVDKQKAEDEAAFKKPVTNVVAMTRAEADKQRQAEGRKVN